MGKRGKLLCGLLFTMLIVVSLIISCAPEPATTSPPTQPTTPTTPTQPTTPTTTAPPKPSSIKVSGVSMGKSGYLQTAAMATKADEATGVPWKVLPRAKVMDRFINTRDGIIDVIYTQNAAIYPMQKGWWEFNMPDWGPQDMRLIYGGGIMQMSMCTQDDSGIYTAADMKGKTATWPRLQAGSYWLMNIAIWDFFGIDFNNKTSDLNYVPLTTGLGTGLLIEGDVDLYIQSPTAGSAYQTAAGPRGMRWLSMPPEDKEGWARQQKTLPFAYPYLAKEGANIPAGGTWVQASGSPYMAYASLDESKAYWATKGFWDGYELYENMHPDLVFYSHDWCLDSDNWSLPFHDGSVKFFKDIGVWTAEHEAVQSKLIEQVKQDIANWKYIPD
ncbi:TAXI family TRAP transporter solute-binding subunit [Chloroflexota bacterium]